MLPHDPVCFDTTCERGSGVDDGVTTPSEEISNDVRSALDRRDCAASILEESIIRDGIAMVEVFFLCNV